MNDPPSRGIFLPFCDKLAAFPRGKRFGRTQWRVPQMEFLYVPSWSRRNRLNKLSWLVAITRSRLVGIQRYSITHIKAAIATQPFISLLQMVVNNFYLIIS
jgi:hypothetical protein